MNIFISCDRADAAFGQQLSAFLSENGFRVLFGAGASVGQADAVVLVLSQHAANSDVCAAAVQTAHRLGKRVIPIMPAPLAIVPGALDPADCIFFYSDPTVPQSGFYDGQKRLLAALRTDQAWRHTVARQHDDDKRRAKDEKKRERQERALTRRANAQMRNQLMKRPRVKFPVFGASVLGVFALAVGAVVFVPGMPQRLRSLVTEASAVMAEEEPYSPNQVAAEDFTSERDLIAVRGGANVRDYPLLSGDLLANVPQGSRLRVTGRLNVQGMRWYRVVMADERVGFVREDVVRWSEPRTTTAADATNVQAIEPSVQIIAGRAGANLRTRPARNGSALVRLPAGATMNATGRVRQGGHWWMRVQLEDGREGFVRDDVLTTESRAALNLT